MEFAWFGCGCFWSAEAAYQDLGDGVETEVGFVLEEGQLPAEVVRVRFDPEKVRFADLLDLFFRIHDPTMALDAEEPGLRSLVAVENEGRLDEARRILEAVMQTDRFEGEATTAFLLRPTYARAAEAHQHYINKHGPP